MTIFLGLLFAVIVLRLGLMSLPASFWAWVELRLPVRAFFVAHLARYPAPRNLNLWYVFGALAMVCVLVQYATGIFLVMYYTPTAEEAFASVAHIMRDVPYGWLVRGMHAVGASAFFVVVYLHMFRALLYGSYKAPRELLWMSGVVLFILLMAEAYTGYVLPWGQMSYWASKVIISLLTAIPYVGGDLVVWLQGDYEVSTVTLHRFFAFHVVGFSFIILAFVMLHITLLHTVGSNNPDGIDIMQTKDASGWPKDAIGYYPYFILKYIPLIMLYLFAFFVVVFYAPTLYGLVLEADNFAPANPLVTPLHIKPAWYLSPFFAILRVIPDKGLGALAMLSSIGVWFLWPWLDRNPVKSMRYRGWLGRGYLAMVVVAFLLLGVLGHYPADGWRLTLGRLATLCYFGYFLLLPVVSSWEKNDAVPKRIPQPD